MFEVFLGVFDIYCMYSGRGGCMLYPWSIEKENGELKDGNFSLWIISYIIIIDNTVMKDTKTFWLIRICHHKTLSAFYSRSLLSCFIYALCIVMQDMATIFWCEFAVFKAFWRQTYRKDLIYKLYILSNLRIKMSILRCMTSYKNSRSIITYVFGKLFMDFEDIV